MAGEIEKWTEVMEMEYLRNVPVVNLEEEYDQE